jgi:hypothetical protein
MRRHATVGALRADAGRAFGAFFDYRIISNVHAEFQWGHNPTTYSGQSTLTGPWFATISSASTSRLV